MEYELIPYGTSFHPMVVKPLAVPDSFTLFTLAIQLRSQMIG